MPSANPDGGVFCGPQAGYLKRRTAYSASGWLELGGLGKWGVGGLRGDEGQRVRVVDLTTGLVRPTIPSLFAQLAAPGVPERAPLDHVTWKGGLLE